MRALLTIFLIALTALLGTWFVNDAFFAGFSNTPEQAESRETGDSLYQDERILQTHHITLSNPTGVPHVFSFNRNYIWECTSPYQDRADGIKFLKPLIEFTLGAEIVDSIPLDQVNIDDYGFKDNWVKVEFSDKEKQSTATYKIGISSAWNKREIFTDERQQTTTTDIPTVFIIKENAPDDQVLYLVADPSFGIHKLFANNFEGFRDHRPFALNRSTMEEVSIKRGNSEIVIDHSTSESPWRISKPLDLPTDRKAIANLLTQLSALEALKLHSPEEVTLPESNEDLVTVSIKNRYIEERTTLTIYPSAADSPASYATVSDRPGVIFELPNLPTPAHKSSLAVLPNSINELRAKNMLTLNRNNIKTIAVSPAFKPRVIVARPKVGEKYRLYGQSGKAEDVNEYALSNLIAAISVLPVKSFVTDAATDLSRYDFQNPILDIAILPFAGAPQRLIFSKKDGKIYAHTYKSRVVWEVHPSTYSLIAKNEWDWKDNTLWSLIVNDITHFSMETAHGETLMVKYDYVGDSFTGTLNGEDISNKINPIQAKYFLNNCHYLVARKRLGPAHESAAKAFETPLLKVSIASSKYDNDGLPTNDIVTKSITIASPTPELKSPSFYYAKVEGEADYLIISPETFAYLSTNIFAEE